MIFSIEGKAIFYTFLFIYTPSALFAGETVIREGTFYSDAFIGSKTSNGETFDQNVFSAALCDSPLNQYLYVKSNNTGIVVDLNDRPNCSRYPNVIDLSSIAFEQFSPLSVGRIESLSVTSIGSSPTARPKSFLNPDTFKHLGIMLTSKIPTIVFAGDTIEISGKISNNDTYVLFYADKEGSTPVSKLVKVGKDKTFHGFITLPNITGDIVFVIASGNSFDTDKYAILSAISEKDLSYPMLEDNARLKISPKVTYSTNDEPIIRIPNGIYGKIEVSSAGKTFQSRGSAFLLEDLPFGIGKAHVKITGFGLSTPSPLDRNRYYSNLFSGSVLLERSHDTIGGDLVKIQNRGSIAKFRFKTPVGTKIRSKYYIIDPNGEVSELSFPKGYIHSDGFLHPQISVNGSIQLEKTGTYLLEIVREDGVAFANIPITRGLAWPIIDPVSPAQVSNIRNNISLVIDSTYIEINALRKSLGKSELLLDKTLTDLAQAKVDDMIHRGYQGHADPDGNYIDYLARRLGFETTGAIGENIGYGTVSDLSLQDGLEESGVHRLNMLQSSWTRVGIGYGISLGKVYLVHVFSE